jgi:hypothetical protein
LDGKAGARLAFEVGGACLGEGAQHPALHLPAHGAAVLVLEG